MTTPGQNETDGQVSKSRLKLGLSFAAVATALVLGVAIKNRIDTIDSDSRISSNSPECPGLKSCFLVTRPEAFNSADVIYVAVKDNAQFYPYMEIYSKPKETNGPVEVFSISTQLPAYHVVKVTACTDQYCEVSVDLPTPHTSANMTEFGIIEPRDINLSPYIPRVHVVAAKPQ